MMILQHILSNIIAFLLNPIGDASKATAYLLLYNLWRI